MSCTLDPAVPDAPTAGDSPDALPSLGQEPSPASIFKGTILPE